MSRRGLVLFAAVSIIWGVPYLFIRIAVQSVSPAFVAWSRVTIGAALLLPIAVHRGSLRGLWSRRAWLVAFAALEMALPFFLIAWGERYVASSFAAILVASLPIIVAVFSVRVDLVEQRAGGRLIGLAVGIVGVMLVVGVDFSGGASELVGALAILTATCCYAGGSLVVKRQLSDLQPLGPVAAALALSSLMLMPSAVSLRPKEIPSADALASIAVLGLVCSAVALLLYFALIIEVGPGRATVIGYTTPIVAVVLGVALLDERLTASAIAGVVLILAGSHLATRNPESRALEPSGGGQRCQASLVRDELQDGQARCADRTGDGSIRERRLDVTSWLEREAIRFTAQPANGLKELLGQRGRQCGPPRVRPVTGKGDAS